MIISPSSSHRALFSIINTIIISFFSSHLWPSPTLQGHPSLHSGIARKHSVLSQDSFRAANYAACLLSPFSFVSLVCLNHGALSQFFVCDTELGKQSAGCATWCRGVGQSTCWGKDWIQVYRWRTDRLLAGVAASLPATDSIFITHLSLHHHWRKPQMVAFVQRSPEESS